MMKNTTYLLSAGFGCNPKIRDESEIVRTGCSPFGKPGKRIG
jgi:hypothetical protein